MSNEENNNKADNDKINENEKEDKIKDDNNDDKIIIKENDDKINENEKKEEYDSEENDSENSMKKMSKEEKDEYIKKISRRRLRLFLVTFFPLCFCICGGCYVIFKKNSKVTLGDRIRTFYIVLISLFCLVPTFILWFPLYFCTCIAYSARQEFKSRKFIKEFKN
jgi:hypothetical protein